MVFTAPTQINGQAIGASWRPVAVDLDLDPPLGGLEAHPELAGGVRVYLSERENKRGRDYCFNVIHRNSIGSFPVLPDS